MIVFLAEIVPAKAMIDNQVWVVSGTVPLAYIDTKSCYSAAEAVGMYCIESALWVRDALTKKKGLGRIVLRTHGSFDRLQTTEDAIMFLPQLSTVIDELVGHADLFDSIPRNGREDLLEIKRAVTRYREKHR